MARDAPTPLESRHRWGADRTAGTLVLTRLGCPAKWRSVPEGTYCAGAFVCTAKSLFRWGLRPSFPGLSQNVRHDGKRHALRSTGRIGRRLKQSLQHPGSRNPRPFGFAQGRLFESREDRAASVRMVSARRGKDGPARKQRKSEGAPPFAFFEGWARCSLKRRVDLAGRRC